jgi:predicted alpha/beta superfamily hydrolase
MFQNSIKTCIGDHDCIIYHPSSWESGKKYPVIYVHDAHGFAEYAVQIDSMIEKEGLEIEDHIFVCIEPINRIHEYTPWPEERIPPNDTAFGGRASEYIDYIINTVKPYIDSHYPALTGPEHTGIMGYSLGGLVTVFALFQSDVFGRAASLSGSFWYNGWIDFIKCHNLLNFRVEIMMSVGENEARNEPEDSIYKQMTWFNKQTHAILQAKIGRNIPLYLDNGDHLDYLVPRMTKALLWFCGKKAQ